jgi:hypothetical protein
MLNKKKTNKLTETNQCESCQQFGKGTCNAFKCIVRNYCDWEEIKRPKPIQKTSNIGKDKEFVKDINVPHKELITDTNVGIKPKELEWEKTLKSVLILTGDEPIEVIFGGGVSKTIRVIPWSMFAIAMNKFYTQQRTELLEDIKDEVEMLGCENGSEVYVEDVLQKITNLLNKKNV